VRQPVSLAARPSDAMRPRSPVRHGSCGEGDQMGKGVDEDRDVSQGGSNVE
jgi:hypothetical protein